MGKIIKQINLVKYLITDPKALYTAIMIYLLSVIRNYKKLADYLYTLTFHKKINWEHPEDLNQWINFLAFTTDTTQWSEFADKYKVKDIIKNRGFEDMVAPLLGKWSNIDDVSFEDLPDTFVLKLNNGCGSIIYVKDKSTANLNDIKQSLREYMGKGFGKHTAEPHYLRIVPMIIAEKYLEGKNQVIPSCSLIDFKFWCFNGKVISCLLITNRTDWGFKYALYSVEDGWKDISAGNLNYSDTRRPLDIAVPRPRSLEKMIEFASNISNGHPQMRVDLYEVDNKPYFGEITMTSFCGRMNYFSSSYLSELGNCVKEAYREIEAKR